MEYNVQLQKIGPGRHDRSVGSTATNYLAPTPEHEKLEQLCQHRAFKKRVRESGEKYKARIHSLEQTAKVMMWSNLSPENIYGSDNQERIANAKNIAAMIHDKNGRIDKKMIDIGVDNNFLNILNSINAYTPNDIDDKLKKIHSETTRNHNKLIRGKVLGIIGGIAAAAIITFTTFAQAPSKNFSQEVPPPPTAAITQTYEEYENSETNNALEEEATVEEVEEEYNPNVTEDALNNANFKPGDVIGVLKLPLLDNREVIVRQGYAYNNDPVASENSNDELMTKRTGDSKILGAVHYNHETDGTEYSTPILDGNKGVHVNEAHNSAAWGNGVQGGFNDLDDSYQEGETFSFESGATTFNYVFVGKIPIKYNRGGTDYWPATVQKDVSSETRDSYYIIRPDGTKVTLDEMNDTVSVLNNNVTPWNPKNEPDSYKILQVCPDKGTPDRQMAVIGYVARLVSTATNGTTRNVN